MNNFHFFMGSKYPLFQAPMAGVQGSKLTIAVCDAGGIGSLPCAMLSVEQLREELETITAATANPYNVNFFCHSLPDDNPQREQSWHEALAPYYKEFGLDDNGVSSGALRLPFSESMCEVLEKYRPPIVSFHFGLPSPELVHKVKSWGASVISSATTLAEARWLEQNGADAIIAQGIEAGGHRGMFLTDDLTTQMGTMSLVSQMVKTVDVPVIAAGGISDARAVNAALTLGAAAVQVGTAYLLCPEVNTSSAHRAALASDRSVHTALTNVFSGRPARSIVNRIIEELGPISSLAPEFPLAASALAPLRSYLEQQGSGDFSPLWCGQNSSGCKEISAAELTRLLVADIA